MSALVIDISTRRRLELKYDRTIPAALTVTEAGRIKKMVDAARTNEEMAAQFEISAAGDTSEAYRTRILADAAWHRGEAARWYQLARITFGDQAVDAYLADLAAELSRAI